MVLFVGRFAFEARATTLFVGNADPADQRGSRGSVQGGESVAIRRIRGDPRCRRTTTFSSINVVRGLSRIQRISRKMRIAPLPNQQYLATYQFLLFFDSQDSLDSHDSRSQRPTSPQPTTTNGLNEKCAARTATYCPSPNRPPRGHRFPPPPGR